MGFGGHVQKTREVHRTVESQFLSKAPRFTLKPLILSGHDEASHRHRGPQARQNANGHQRIVYGMEATHPKQTRTNGLTRTIWIFREINHIGDDLSLESIRDNSAS